MYVVLIGSITNIIYFLGQGDFRTGYELLTGAVMVCAAVSGIMLSNSLVKKLGRPSILVFFLTGVVFLSVVILPVTEALKLTGSKKAVEDMWKLSNYCLHKK
jgi:predicted permease